ncbi:hypothetical protein HID58_059465 [Brassica napus]|uniref:Uncharacterized protein n=1 Tax=Brassica napus TaxID=3708 RepID=A0ABQ7ZT04_BRANA|nr:hypothetical protein HID58_059465 [Brassica napus]
MEDTDGERFDYCDDPDGATSDDEDFIAYGLPLESFGSQLWDTVFAVQALLASDLCDETYEVLRRGHKYIKISQRTLQVTSRACVVTHPKAHVPFLIEIMDGKFEICCMLLSTMPADVTGQKIDPEHLFDSVNLLLSLHSENGGFTA